MGNPIVHWELIGPDPIKLQKYYKELFDWKLTDPAGPEMGYYAQVDPSSSGVGGGIGGDPSGTNRSTIYVQASDIQAKLDQAVQMGGKMLMPVTEIIPGQVTIAMFADPAGNVVGLLKG